MEKIAKIKKLCEKTIKETSKIIFDRAKLYADNGKLTKKDKDELLELEPKGLAADFSSEDLENHYFDLSRIRMAKEILEICGE
jgi:hypothetical protein